MEKIQGLKKSTIETIQSIQLGLEVMRDLADAALTAALDDRWEDAEFYLGQLEERNAVIGTFTTSGVN